MVRPAIVFAAACIVLFCVGANAEATFFADPAAFSNYPGYFVLTTFDSPASYNAGAFPFFRANSYIYEPAFMTSSSVPLVDLYLRTLSTLAAVDGYFYANFDTPYPVIGLGSRYLSGDTAFGFYLDVPPNNYYYGNPNFSSYYLATNPFSSVSTNTYPYYDVQYFFSELLPVSVGDFFGIYGLSDGYLFGGFARLTDAGSGFQNCNIAIKRIITAAAYIGSGGDPHMVARGIRSDLPGLEAGHIVNLVEHPAIVVNARLRSFGFLPPSATFYSTVAVEMANGDQIFVEAFENDDGRPVYVVMLNRVAVELGSEVLGRGFVLRYKIFGDMENTPSSSWFHEKFPYMDHNALVRIHTPDALVVDVSLSSKEAFVDWSGSQPEVYTQAGAFLNVAVRDLAQQSESLMEGLLKDAELVHARRKAMERAVASGEMKERDLLDDVSFKNLLSDVVEAHRVDSLF